MIKKYITLAALLTAGSAFVNALDENPSGSQYRFTTTFERTSALGEQVINDQTQVHDVHNTPDTLYSTIRHNGLSLRDGNGSKINMAGKYSTEYPNYISPSISLNTGNSWQIGFNYNSLGPLSGIEFKVTSIDLYLGTTQGSGVFKHHWTTEHARSYYDVTLSFGSQESIFKSQYVEGNGHHQISSPEGGFVNAGYGIGPSDTPVRLTFGEDAPIFSQGQDSNFTLKLSNGTSDTFVGIQKIVVYADTYYPPIVPDPEPIVPTPTPTPPTPSDPNLPEPSAFGLLAGLGALALVSARRRRK